MSESNSKAKSGAAQNPKPKNFQRLLDDLHADLDEILDLLLEADLNENDLRTLYPSAWRHLQSCPQCAAEYALWKATVMEVDFNLAPPLPAAQTKPLPVAQSTMPNKSVEEAPWRYYLRSLLPNEPFHLRFDFAVEQLIERLSGQLAAATRHLQSFDQVEVLPILLQPLALADGELLVEVIFAPLSPGATEGHLLVRLIASLPNLVPADVSIALRWGSIERHSPFDEGGEADLGVVTLQELRTPTATPIQVSVTLYQTNLDDPRSN